MLLYRLSCTTGKFYSIRVRWPTINAKTVARCKFFCVIKFSLELFFEKKMLIWKSSSKCNPSLARFAGLCIDVHSTDICVDLHLDWPSTDLDLQLSPSYFFLLLSHYCVTGFQF